MHFTHSPFRPFSPPTVTNTSNRLYNRGITKVLKQVNNILSSDSSPMTSIQDLLTFKTTQENYLIHTISLINKPKLERTSLDLHIISGYFSYISEFQNMIKRYYREKAKDVLKKIADAMNYIKCESNELIIRNGEEGKLYYLILNGSVDVFVKKRYQEKITVNDYYRYLAFLIGYNEIEILNEVININKDIIPIEIADSNGYGKIINDNKNTSLHFSNKTTYTQVYLEEIFRTLTIEEWNELNSLGHVIINSHNGKVFPLNEWYDYNTPMRTGTVIPNSRIKHKKVKITSDEYINRFTKYKCKVISHNFQEEQELFLHKLKDISLQTSTLLSLTLCCYVKKTRLIAGQCFGEFALNDPYSKRTASVISNTTCHLGTFTKNDYATLIKDAADKNRKIYMLFIISISVFKGISLRVLQKRYFTNFIAHRIEKNTYAVKEKENMNYVYLFKEGTYEYSINTSLCNIGDIINTLFEKLRAVLNNVSYTNGNSHSYDKVKNEIYELYEKIKEMKVENVTIKDTAEDVQLLRNFYYDKTIFKIYTSDTHDLLGFDDLCLDNNESIFSVKCISSFGEYLVLNKETYNDMTSNHNDMLKSEKEYCYMKNYKTIKRLLDMRRIKIQTFIDQNKINNVLHLKGYIDPHQSNDNIQTINSIQSNSNSKRIINKRKSNLLINSTKTLITSPVLMQNFMRSVRAIKHNSTNNNNNIRFISSSCINNTLSKSNSRLHSPSTRNDRSTSQKVNLTLSARNINNNFKHFSNKPSSTMFTDIKSHISNNASSSNSNINIKTYKHPISRQHNSLILPSQDALMTSTNNRIFQLTKNNVFNHRQQPNVKHFHTSHSSLTAQSTTKTNQFTNNGNNTATKMISHYVQVPSLANDVNGGIIHKSRTCNSGDVFASKTNNEDVNCFGDYEIQKKEKYIEKRKVYLMKSTRDFFLRYKEEIKMKKRKKGNK